MTTLTELQGFEKCRKVIFSSILLPKELSFECSRVAAMPY